MIVRQRLQGFGYTAGAARLEASPLLREMGMTGVVDIPIPDALNAKVYVQNAKTSALPPEEIYPDDPRHPDYKLWLKRQKKTATRKSAMKLAAYGGGGLLVLFLAVALLKRRKHAKVVTS